MSFLYPNFLYALAFLAIPIIVHLFQFRRFKVVRFSKIDFLEEIEERNNSISKLKHILVLISRLLALSFLVLAFARPFIPTTDKAIQNSSNQVVGIYIDNSFSMNTENERGVLLDLAIDRCIELIKSYPLDKKYIILSNDFTNETSRILDKNKAIKAIQEIESSAMVRELSEVSKRFLSIHPELNEAYIFSDFQKSTIGLEKINTSNLSYNVLQFVRSEDENISIDSISFSQPIHFNQQSNKKLATFFNPHYLDNERELNIELYLNGKLITPSQLLIMEKVEKEKLNFSNPDERTWNTGFVKIEDYPLSFDDTLFFSYKVNRQLNVLHLFDDQYNAGINALFEYDSAANYQLMNSSKIDYSMFDQQQLIILDELEFFASGLQLEIKKYLNGGGKICVIPSFELRELNNFLSDVSSVKMEPSSQNGKIALKEINKNSFIFLNVFDEIPKNLRLPYIDSAYHLITSSRTDEEIIISMEDNRTFLSLIGNDQAANIYLFSAPLSVNESFQNNALFVPSFYNMAISGFKNNPLFYFLNDESISLHHKLPEKTPIHIMVGEKKMIPYQLYKNGSITIKLQNLNLKAGNYPIYHNDSLIDYLSLNYDRVESDLMAHSDEELESSMKIKGITINNLDTTQNFEQLIKEQIIGKEYWQYALLLSLVFFIIEIALLRLMNPIL